MIEGWREFLYPLGYFAQLAFGWRFLQQWLMSELKQQSIVTRAFWKMSLFGNILLTIHAFLQLQFHVCAIQACNGIIAWRNLNLMEDSSKQYQLRSVILLMVSSFLMIFTGFLLQGYFLGDGIVEWFRLPIWEGYPAQHVGFLWHLIGFVGLALFSSRFWVQWWGSERDKTSHVGPSFWWLSLSGGVMSLIYFTYIEDPVNMIGPAVGLLPYARNLMLMRKAQHSQKPVNQS